MSELIKTIRPDPATTIKQRKRTDVGSVFVSNYPPYSFWSKEHLPAAFKALNQPAEFETPLGLYLHIPFCRKRCKFCYFKVYTDKNSQEIQGYLDNLVKEIELYAKMAAVRNRPLKFVYFGGGTPSFISAKHLKALVARAKAAMSWQAAEEVAFECEPGTLTQSKLEAIREIGVTRLSLGIEHFDDGILRENGRAHISKEIYRVLPWIEALDFDQVNIDLIAGMVGETWEKWRETVDRAIEFDPDSVTIYQMELPYNTIYSQMIKDGAKSPVAGWELKREWHGYAIDTFLKNGYEISSAYTLVKKDKQCRFVYRDALWHGADMIATGVASFSHLGGIHFQNVSSWGEYLANLDTGKLPIGRAFATNKRERLIREMILQLKLRRIQAAYFQRKFGENILAEFAPAFEYLQDQKMLRIESDEVVLTRKGLLCVDQLLPNFYDAGYRDARYT